MIVRGTWLIPPAPGWIAAVRSISISSLVILLAAGLVSCKVGQDYTAPMPEMPATWYTDYNSSVAGEDITDIADGSEPLLVELRWWEIFRDANLQTYIRAALDNNRDLNVALLTIEKSRNVFRVERAGLFPSVDLEIKSDREKLSLLEDGSSNISNDHFIGFDASWELDLWGAKRRANEAAYAEYLGSAYAWQATRLVLISDVASAYFSLLGSDARLRISRNTAVARQEALGIAVKRFEGGLTSELEVKQAEVELASAKAAIPELEQERFAIENRLSILLGKHPRHYGLETTIADQYIPDRIKPGLPSALLQRRPDIMRSERELKSASEKTGIARAAFFPTFRITGNLGFETAEFSDLLDSDGEKWLIDANLLTPIFNAGKLKAQQRLAELTYQQALLKYEQSILSALQEVSDSLTRFHKAREILQLRQELVTASREYLALALKRYRRGVLAYLDVLDAQRKLLDAQLSATTSRESQLQSLISIYKALGGGWQPGSDSSTVTSP